MRKALYPGSFDPFTIGHEAVVRRALRLFDRVVIALGVNPGKKPFLETEMRLMAIQSLFASEERIEVVSYSGLTMDLAKELKADCIIRGLRNSMDSEYEAEMAAANLSLGGIETVFLMAEPENAHVSSSLVRELLLHGKDVSALVPEGIMPYLQKH